MKRYLPFAIIAGVLVIALAGGLFFYRSSQQPKSPSQSFTQSSPTATPALQPGRGAPTPVVQQAPTDYANAHARGGANAKATLEEYGDYQCPPCGYLFHELKTLEKEYGDEMRFVFRHYPLPNIHKHAVMAAQAAEAAGLQGKFWEMHDLLYQNQLSWSPVDDARPVFLQYARDLKLDVDRFTRDMESAEVAARVRADSERGSALKVEGTPTIFINGRQLRPEAMTQEGLRMALDYVLGKKR
jgi:protein-disulfide isomerase